MGFFRQEFKQIADSSTITPQLLILGARRSGALFIMIRLHGIFVRPSAGRILSPSQLDLLLGHSECFNGCYEASRGLEVSRFLIHTTISMCQFVGSPPLNSDIAGIGVRISTYVQAFLASEWNLSLNIPSWRTISRGYHYISFAGRNLQPSLDVHDHEHICCHRCSYSRLLVRSSNQPSRVGSYYSLDTRTHSD